MSNMSEDQLDLGSLIFRDKNGKVISSDNLSDFLRDRREKMITVNHKVYIGDVVKLKITNEVVKVVAANYDKKQFEGFDEIQNATIVFGQEDIERIISRSGNKNVRSK